MLVLCLDTATADIAAAVTEVTQTPAGVRMDIRAECRRRDPRGAGEHLVPLILAAVEDSNVTLEALDAVAVGLGPGPFTGLRVGVVTGAVLARSIGVPAYGACTLDVLAAPDVVVATDARRREVYWASYGPTGVREEGPAVDLPADVAARFPGRRVIGPGALLYADLLGGRAADDAPLPVSRLAALVAARALAGAPGEALVPLYLRRPDAIAVPR